MKTLLLCALTALVPAVALAQNTASPRIRRVPSPPATQGASRATAQKLDENITLSWKGALVGSHEIDLELSGCGPQFQADITIPGQAEDDMPPTILTVSTVVTEVEDAYRAEFSVGARIPVKSRSTQKVPGGAETATFEFRDLMIRGEVILKPGEPVTISKASGKKLTLMLSKAG